MQKHHITVTKDDQVFNFEVADYPHHQHDHCKFEVFQGDSLVAGFEPDAQQILHICNNTGKLDEEVLYLLADEIERYAW